MITKSQLDENVINFYNNNINSFNKKNYIKHGYSESIIVKYYGKWSNLCEYLNLPYAKRNRYSKDEILLDIKTVIAKTNNATRDNYAIHGIYSKCAYEKYIGNWNEILTILNIDINMNKNYSKEDVIDEMLSLQQKHNGYFTAEIQRKYSKYSQPVIDRLFGSFSNMLRELNLRSPYGKNISNEEIIKQIKDIYLKYGTISCDLIDEHSCLSAATIINRFGSMQNAYELAGVEQRIINQSKLSIYILNICNNILNETPKLEYTFEWLINPKTNKKLRVDAYYPNNNLIIEVDGEQHFKEKTSFKSSLKEIKYRDSIKDILIPKNNINLLRIPYYFSIDQIIKSVEKFI